VFTQNAKQQNAELTFASEEWNVEVRVGSREVKSERQKVKAEDLKFLDLEVAPRSPLPAPHSPLNNHYLQLDLPGTYQLKNVKTVLSAVTELRKQGFIITDEHISTALKQVKTLTGLHGRWEVLSNHPLTICDTGHNPEGIQEVLKSIAAVTYQQLHFVIGVVNDKDISKILTMLPKDAVYYFCKPDIPRGLEAESLKQQAESIGLHGETYSSVPDAFHAAQAKAGDNDLVFVGGSTFVVAEVV
jgi:dihydrofolate synthase/folylpolyglutamate synthase